MTEVRATSELLPNGTLHVKAEYLKNGEWIPGHQISYKEDASAHRLRPGRLRPVNNYASKVRSCFRVASRRLPTSPQASGAAHPSRTNWERGTRRVLEIFQWAYSGTALVPCSTSLMQTGCKSAAIFPSMAVHAGGAEAEEAELVAVAAGVLLLE